MWKGATDKVVLGLEKRLTITVPRGRYGELVATTNIQQPIIAPIEVGQVLGQVDIHLAGELVATKQLVAIEAVENGSWWRQLLDTLLMLIWG